MGMNRRNVLVGLGAVAVGGGAAFGSGAFSQVEAERTMNVSTAGDANALLGLDPNDSSDNSYSSASSLANDNTLKLTFDALGSSKGLNIDAETTFDPIFRILNNGGNAADVRIDTPSGGNGTVTTSGTVLDSGAVIQNSVTDGNNSVTIEYKFTDSASPPSSIVANGSGTGSPVNIGSNGQQVVGLVIGISDPGGQFDPTNVSSGEYIQELRIVANDST
jgi:hypothetical protein